MSEIACNVSNCEYWDNGNICAADKISVSNNSYAGESATMEIGAIDDEVASPKSQHTQCVTFKPADK
ncbi:DUF1540 domain-containing protein [Sporohalobacter salinus]|uniref:DUF1540 domain-containing protein n=1 Tax=Sporohalobacter salinus TaxID=1494606 RepID=UPI0019615933|nr:DUF1540 domain-containing protein [Sporohalobacter salinus]MBM7624856.1 hypothetical protein [Sporohalobacter salinus]